MKDDRLYLLHISECIAWIEEFSVDGREVFLKDRKTQDAVLRNLQTLAESTQRLSDSVKDAYPEINWRGIAGFRNFLVHDYLGLDLLRIWEIVEEFLPDLKRKLQPLLDGLPPQRSTQ